MATQTTQKLLVSIFDFEELVCGSREDDSRRERSSWPRGQPIEEIYLRTCVLPRGY